MKKSIFVLLILCLIGGLLGLCHQLHLTDLASVRAFILSFGILAPLIYIIMFTLVPLTLFPDAILAISAGTLFGVFWGSVYTMIGAVCGASLSFFIARYLGRDWVLKLVRHKGQWFEEGVERQGFLIILVLRLVPLIPFDIISYGAGLSKIKFKDFLAGSIIGIIPGVVIYVNLGDKALDVHSPAFMISIALLIGLFSLSYVLKKKYTFEEIQNKLKKEEEYT